MKLQHVITALAKIAVVKRRNIYNMDSLYSEKAPEESYETQRAVNSITYTINNKSKLITLFTNSLLDT